MHVDLAHRIKKRDHSVAYLTLAALLLTIAACSGAQPGDAAYPDDNQPSDAVTTIVLTADVDGDGANDMVTAYLGRSGDRGFFAIDLAPIGDDEPTATPIFPIWSAHTADLDGDRRAEIVAGSWSNTPRHDEPNPHRAAWVLGLRDGRLVALWRGSAFVRPLVDLTTADLDDDGITEVLTVERATPSIEGDGGCVVAAYRWTGFGFVEVDHSPAPCDALLLGHDLGQDGRPGVIHTAAGPRAVRLENRELVFNVLE